MKSKATIINDLVLSAADIMEAKKDYNQLVIDQFKESNMRVGTVARLQDMNDKITQAVELIRDYSGSW